MMSIRTAEMEYKIPLTACPIGPWENVRVFLPFLFCPLEKYTGFAHDLGRPWTLKPCRCEDVRMGGFVVLDSAVESNAKGDGGNSLLFKNLHKKMYKKLLPWGLELIELLSCGSFTWNSGPRRCPKGSQE